MTRWLDPSEQRAWRAYIDGTRLVAERIDRDLQREADMPHGYYEVLVRLSEAPCRTLRMSELATSSRSSRSRLSHAVARLESRGWVRRETCATDARGALAVLTDQGFAALAAAAPGHVESVRRHLLEHMTREEFLALGTMLGHVRDALAGAEPGDSPQA